MKKRIVLFLAVLLVPLGISATTYTGTVTIVNAKLSLVNGTAFVTTSYTALAYPHPLVDDTPAPQGGSIVYTPFIH